MGLSLNRTYLIGNLGSDPEFTEPRNRDGKPRASFSIATEFAKQVTWHYVTCFGQLAEVARDYLFKGSKCFVEGYINNWRNEEKGTHGSEVIARELIVLSWDNVPEGGGDHDARRGNEPPQQYRRGKQSGGYQSRRGNQQRQQASQQGGDPNSGRARNTYPGAAQNQRNRGQRTVGRPNQPYPSDYDDSPQEQERFPDDD